MISRAFLACCVAAAAFATYADASLIGDSVHATAFNTLLNSDIVDTSAVVTDPGVEFSVAVTGAFVFEADLNADSVTLTELYDSPTFQGIFAETTWTFTDLDWVGQPGTITNVVEQNPGTTPLTVNLLGPDSFSITLPEVTLSPMQSVSYSFDIVTTHTSIPEPSTFTIMALLGMSYVGLHHWRRHRGHERPPSAQASHPMAKRG